MPAALARVPLVRAVGGVVLLLAVVFTAYIPALQAGLIRFDDENYVAKNELLRTPEGLWKIWFDQGAYRQGVQWYPLTHTTYWIEHQFWGTDPTGYHATNVAFHALNAVLVWLLLRWLRLPGAFAAALIFAVHPVQVQSVAWIAERKNVLSGFFYLLTALAWLRFAGAWGASVSSRKFDSQVGESEASASPREMGKAGASPSPGCRNGLLSHNTRAVAWYGLALVLFALGLFSKTAVCTLPVVLVVWVWWRRPEAWKRLLPAVVPFVVLALAMGLATLGREMSYTVGGEGFGRDLSPAQNVLIAGRALWFYAWKLLVPLHLIPLYPRWEIDPGAVLQWVFPLTAAALPVVWWVFRRRLGKGPLVAVLYFAITLGPVLSFIDFGFLGHAYVTDHFQYLPCIGLIALLVAAVAGLLRHLPAYRRALGVGLSVVVVGGLGTLSWGQSRVYTNPETFWSKVVSGNPSHRAYSALGDAYLRKGDTAKAREFLLKAAETGAYSRTHYRLGELYAGDKEYEQALAQFQRALEINRSGHLNVQDMDKGLLFNMGMMCSRLRDFERAADYYRQALEIDPDWEQARRWLADAERRIQRPRGQGGSDP